MEDADCVILCVPVGVLGEVSEAIAPHLKSGATLSDVGSVKAAAAAQMAAHSPDHVHVIPGHPIAGTEKSGPDAGLSDLFDGRWMILTPVSNMGADYRGAVQMLTAFWQRLGSKVELMDRERHDLVLAITSHLPHLIAYNLSLIHI